MSPLLSYRPSLNAITDKSNLLSNDHIEIKNVLLEACRKYGNKGLNQDFLSLENKNVTVNVTIFKSELISIEIFPELTIKSLKERLWEILGIPVINQRLKHKGELLNDTYTIKSYGIDKDSVVELIPYFRNTSININIINENVNLNLDANPDCKIKYIKKFIEYKSSVKVDQQILINMGRNLDDNSTLSAYNLANMSFIYLKIRN